jgi:outer membrane protein OmpA-like peptidoglycan-associated protein
MVGSAAQKIGALSAGTRISVIAHAPKTGTANDRVLATKRANAVAKALKVALGKTRAAGLRFTVVTQSSFVPAQNNQITIGFAS